MSQEFDNALNKELTELEFIFKHCTDVRDGVYTDAELERVELAGYRLIAAAKRERESEP